jgi:hypothetical protein
MRTLTLPALPAATSLESLVRNTYAAFKVIVGAAASVTTIANMCNDSRVQEFTLGLLANGVATTTAFSSAQSIRKASLGVKNTFTINASMSAADLNALYTSLPDINGSGYSITVSGNYGYATSDTSILTTKGWAPL